jgi:hypothetical protein
VFIHSWENHEEIHWVHSFIHLPCLPVHCPLTTSPRGEELMRILIFRNEEVNPLPLRALIQWGLNEIWVMVDWIGACAVVTQSCVHPSSVLIWKPLNSYPSSTVSNTWDTCRVGKHWCNQWVSNRERTSESEQKRRGLIYLKDLTILNWKHIVDVLMIDKSKLKLITC